MNTDPHHTLELLDTLQSLGFDDSAFVVVHHMPVTIDRHRRYCMKTGEFQVNSKNALVQQRLEIILAAFKAGGFANGSSELFYKLARDATVKVPL